MCKNNYHDALKDVQEAISLIRLKTRGIYECSKNDEKGKGTSAWKA
jgi:hypothetical protein